MHAQPVEVAQDPGVLDRRLGKPGAGRRDEAAGRAGQGAPSRPLRGGGRDAAACGGGASDRRAADRVLAVVPLRRERHPERPARRRGQPNVPESLPVLRSYIAGDLFFGIGMVLLLIAFSVWGISRVITLQSEQEAEVQTEATGLSISEALIGTPVETVAAEVTLIPAEDTPIPGLPEGTVEIPTPAANVNVQVNIVAIERSYLRVIVDGEVAFNGRTIPGNVYPFDAEQSIEVLAGNGAALRVIYNQRDIGLLGGFGQVASFIYTIDEILVPTPEVPPTATLTPFISPTPSITPSPTLTPTGTP